MTVDCQCPFCTEEDAIFCNELGYVRYQDRPSAPGHLLILPRRHVADFFNIMWEEKFALVNLLAMARRYLADKYSPDGYKVEITIGEAAGQTVMHTHIHLIPFFKEGNTHGSPDH
jgi:diadenosine tetraphosphate (Ap4A) HIT family hydrolase